MSKYIYIADIKLYIYIPIGKSFICPLSMNYNTTANGNFGIKNGIISNRSYLITNRV